MLPIYICEDEPAIRHLIASHVSAFYTLHQEYGLPEIFSYSDPFELLRCFPQNPGMGIYFLDIQLEAEMNGLQLAREIRMRDPKGFLVFITSHAEYASTTLRLQVEAFGYIRKDKGNLTSLITATLTCIHERYALFQQFSLDNPRIQLRCGHCLHYFFANDILAFGTTSRSHRICIYKSDGCMEFSGSLAKILPGLPKSHFLKCHRSYIVNLNHLVSYDADKHMVQLSNQMLVPVSRDKQAFFLSSLF